MSRSLSPSALAMLKNSPPASATALLRRTRVCPSGASLLGEEAESGLFVTDFFFAFAFPLRFCNCIRYTRHLTQVSVRRQPTRMNRPLDINTPLASGSTPTYYGGYYTYYGEVS